MRLLGAGTGASESGRWRRAGAGYGDVTGAVRVGPGPGRAGLDRGDMTKWSNGAAWEASGSGPCAGHNVTMGT